MHIHERLNNQTGEISLPAKVHIACFFCLLEEILVDFNFHLHYNISDSEAPQYKWNLNFVANKGMDLDISILNLEFGTKLSLTKISTIRFSTTGQLELNCNCRKNKKSVYLSFTFK